MAVTKVTDAMRNVTEVDAAKITTGTIPDARISASSVNAHVDLTPVKHDISLLSLQTAINGNMTAFGLKNSWIEQFENSTYIEALTQVVRDTSSEYVSSIYTTYGTPAYVTGNRTSTITGTKSGFTWQGGTTPNLLNGSMTQDTSNSSYFTNLETPSAGAYIRFQFDASYLVTEAKWHSHVGATTAEYGVWQWQGSANGSDWTDIGANTFLADGATLLHTSLNGNTTDYTYYQLLYVSGVMHSSDWHTEIEFKQVAATLNNNATGSFNSTDVVPQDAVNKSSVGLVMLYKDEDGTNTLDTDIIAKVRANTGQAYQTLALRGIDGTTTPSGAFSDGMKIAIAPAIAVTAGQALSYEISFANQVSSSKEARIYGVAMTY